MTCGRPERERVALAFLRADRYQSGDDVVYKLTVKVKAADNGGFQSHKVICLYTEKVPAEKSNGSKNANGFELESPGYRSGKLELSNDVWQCAIALPEKSAIEDLVTLKVVAPDGTIIKEHHHKLAGAEGSECEIFAQPVEYDVLESPGATSTRMRVRGRVIDIAGQALIAGEQVAVIADSDADPQEIVAVTRTDSQGYFSVDCPKRTFSKVFVKVANYPAETITLQAGELPEQIILAVAAHTDYEAEKDGCACETPVPALPDADDIISSPQAYTSDVTGGCVSFTKPNRTIEEFDFYGVVRTTEPEIVGMTLPEPNFIPADKVKALMPFRPYRPTADSTAGQGSAGGAHTGTSGGTKTTTTNPRGTKKGSKASKSRSSALRRSNPMPAITVERAASAGGGATTISADILKKLIDPRILKQLAKTKGGYTDDVLIEAARQTEESEIDKVMARASRSAAARSELSVLNPLDWDEDPTFYQAATIAHGHILHFKQTWKANGFSLGDLLYSLPLAPGQKRQVAILDWERREVASRSESLELEEQLAANLTRDRDIQEIVSASLKEDVVGASLSVTASSASNSGSSGPGSGAASALMMVAGSASGIGGGASVGFQHGSRKASANSLQQVRDRISQSASSMRSQRSTVVQSVAQGETLRAQTEVIANYNHCHAITVEYFEVLRHFAVEHKLVEVQECLFVPLLMSPFDRDKILRWRQPLQKGLRDRRLLPAFDALDRIAHNYDGADVPVGSYADEAISRIEGLLRVSFRLVRPSDKEVANGQMMPDAAAWSGIGQLLGTSADTTNNGQIANATDKDKAFLEYLGPQIAAELVDRIQLVVVDKGVETPIALQFDLVSDFKNKVPLQVRVRSTGKLPASMTRRKITDVQLRVRGLKPNVPLSQDLPPGTRMTLELAQLRYETDHIHYSLLSSGRLSENLIDDDGATIPSPIMPAELRNPRNEDRERANALMTHLHDNMEYYHRTIWQSMDPSRRFMLLDGIVAPNANGRSVASVVENRLIGIAGNSMILPVVPGMKLDPVYKQEQEKSENQVSLLDAYMPEEPTPPLLVAVPTRGVYAESVMGSCNSCEKKDETRFWRWEESPLPDQPSPIGMLNTDSRGTPAPDLTAKDFAAPIINLQNAPAAPDPTGLAAMLGLIGKGDSFRDLTGLNQNQLNAAAALEAGFGTSSALAESARAAAKQQLVDNMGPITEFIKQGRADGLIGEDEAKQAFTALSKQLTDPGETRKGLGGTLSDVFGGAKEAVGGVAKEISGSISNKDGTLTFGAKGSDGLGDLRVGGNTAARILLPQEAADKGLQKLRAFNPGSDKSGQIILEVRANSQTPPDAFFRLEIAKIQTYQLDAIADVAIKDLTPSNKLSKKYEIKAVFPGQIDLECLLLQRVPADNDENSGGTSKTTAQVLQSIVIPLSVPKYYRISEDPGFDQFLGRFPTSSVGLSLLDVKEQVIAHMKEAAEAALTTANVRLIWRLGASPDAEPEVMLKVYNPGALNEVTLEDRQAPFTLTTGQLIPAGTYLGYNSNFVASDVVIQLNTPIHVWPGELDRQSQNQEIDSIMLNILENIQASTQSIPEQFSQIAKIVGRYIGETVAHEIGHSLLGVTSLGGHSKGGLMRDARTFINRTGLDITVDSTPDPNVPYPLESDVPDLGVGLINKFDRDCQDQIDVTFPTIPGPIIR